MSLCIFHCIILKSSYFSIKDTSLIREVEYDDLTTLQLLCLHCDDSLLRRDFTTNSIFFVNLSEDEREEILSKDFDEHSTAYVD